MEITGENRAHGKQNACGTTGDIIKVEGNSALVTWPVDVWFNGSPTFQAVLDFGGRAITSIQLDPSCRFPDRDPGDNVWPRGATVAPPCGG